MNGPAQGTSRVAPVANAAADAACPLGKDEVQGAVRIRRASRVRSGSGRRRPNSGLSTTLDTKLAAPRLARPRIAPRRVRRPASAPTAATPIHSRPWSAVLVRIRSAWSTGRATATGAGTIIGLGGRSVTRIRSRVGRSRGVLRAGRALAAGTPVGRAVHERRAADRRAAARARLVRPPVDVEGPVEVARLPVHVDV